MKTSIVKNRTTKKFVDEQVGLGCRLFAQRGGFSHTPGKGEHAHDKTLDATRLGVGHVEYGQAKTHDERLAQVGQEDRHDEDAHREDVRGVQRRDAELRHLEDVERKADHNTCSESRGQSCV